jgi:hypothetical protein
VQKISAKAAQGMKMHHCPENPFLEKVKSEVIIFSAAKLDDFPGRNHICLLVLLKPEVIIPGDEIFPDIRQG